MDGLVVLLNEAGTSIATLKQYLNEAGQRIKDLEEKAEHCVCGKDAPEAPAETAPASKK